MYYGTKEEQAQILQKVIAASDQDAEEERLAGEGVLGKAMVMCDVIGFSGMQHIRERPVKTRMTNGIEIVAKFHLQRAHILFLMSQEFHYLKMGFVT